MTDLAAKLRELAASALRAGKPIEIAAEQLLSLVEGMTAVDESIIALRAEVSDVRRLDELHRQELLRLDAQIAKYQARLMIVEPVFEASLALRRSESRAALASDVIAEIEAERALTDAQVEARSHAALTRWRTAVDAALHIEAAKERSNG